MRNEELGIRNEGGGFAANIYGAMPESHMQVPSDVHCFKGVQGPGFRGVVRRIKTGKRRGVLKYMVFTKDERPVNLLNLQNLFNL